MTSKFTAKASELWAQHDEAFKALYRETSEAQKAVLRDRCYALAKAAWAKQTQEKRDE